MEEELRAKLLSRVRAHVAETGARLSTMGRDFAGDSMFFRRLEDPSLSFLVRTYDEVMAWFDAGCPKPAPGEKPERIKRKKERRSAA